MKKRHHDHDCVITGTSWWRIWFFGDWDLL